MPRPIRPFEIEYDGGKHDAITRKRLPFSPLLKVGQLREEVKKRMRWERFDIYARQGLDGDAYLLYDEDALEYVVHEDDKRDGVDHTTICLLAERMGHFFCILGRQI